jgi:hypothetical protein
MSFQESKQSVSKVWVKSANEYAEAAQRYVKETVQFTYTLQHQFANGAPDIKWLQNWSEMVYRSRACAAAAVVCANAAAVCYREELLPDHAKLVSPMVPLVASVQAVAVQVCLSAIDVPAGITEFVEETSLRVLVLEQIAHSTLLGMVNVAGLEEKIKETNRMKANVMQLPQTKRPPRRLLLCDFDIAEAESRAAEARAAVDQVVSLANRTMAAVQQLTLKPTLYTEGIKKE